MMNRPNRMSLPAILASAVVLTGAVVAQPEPEPAAPDADASVARVEAWLADGNGIDDAFRALAATHARSVVELKSTLRGRTRRILGTVVDSSGLVLTKSSELGEDVGGLLHDGTAAAAKVLARSEEFDLALVSLEAGGLAAVTPAEVTLPAGAWVVSVGAGGRAMSVGIVSVAERDVRPPFGGYLGVRIEDDAAGGARVRSVDDDSAAQRAGLLVDDVIVRLGDEEIRGRVSLVRSLVARSPGAPVDLLVRRDGEEVMLKARLGQRPELSRGPSRQQLRLSGSLSRRRTRFPGAVQHDGVLRPTQCGGPLVDVRGRLVGINIARADRTHSLALSGRTLTKALAQLRAEAAASRKAGGVPAPTRDG